VAALCGQASPQAPPLRMLPARVNNVPKASRKSCEAKPSGVSVIGGSCETPPIHHERRAQDTTLSEHSKWRALRRRVRDVNQKRGGLRKQDRVNFDWRRSMGSCARRAGEGRAHSNQRRLKEGWSLGRGKFEPELTKMD